MEIRPTRMLKWAEVQEDLGISQKQLQNFIELGILKPIYLGNGWKFSQQDILAFQKTMPDWMLAIMKKQEL